MAGSKRRPDQVGEAIRQVIAEALLHEVRDPRVQLATVTRVQVTPDLSHARVFVAVHGEAAREDALAGLTSAAGFLRTRVARTLATRITPELAFEIDRGVEHAARIDELLGAIRRGEEVP
ncbi:MAG: 30S ribosome-binding factor RbfA [Gemmatimonadales bacterium]